MPLYDCLLLRWRPIQGISCQQLRLNGRCRAIAARHAVADRPLYCTHQRVSFRSVRAVQHPCNANRWCVRSLCWFCSQWEESSSCPRFPCCSPQYHLRDPSQKSWLRAEISVEYLGNGGFMTLGRFLILFLIGLVLAITVPQLSWLAWVLAAAALLVVVQLIRS